MFITSVSNFRDYSSQRSKESTSIESFDVNSSTQTLSLSDNNNSYYGNKEILQANCPDRPVESTHAQKVMNSRLIAKHWIQNLSAKSKYESLEFQKSSIYHGKDKPQKNGSVNNNSLRIFNAELRRSSTSTIMTILSK